MQAAGSLDDSVGSVAHMRCSGWSVGLALAVGLVVAGCDGSDDGDDASSGSAAATTAPDVTATTAATDTTAPASTAVTDTTTSAGAAITLVTTPANTVDAAITPVTTPTDTAITLVTTPANTVDAAITPVTTPADTVVTDATESASTAVTDTTTTPGDSADGSAAAVVEIGAERFEFRVIRCLRNRPSVLGDQRIDITLDGVPPDTPDDLIEPLLDAIDRDTDVLPLLEPVLEYGPALTISRFEDGGDSLVVYDLADVEYVSDPNPLSNDARFLSISDGDSDIVIAGATTSDGSPLAVAATCP